jgi:type II secretory pathway component PulK
MRARRTSYASEKRNGTVLLAVLVVVVVLTLAAYQFSEMMLAEYKAADSHRRLAQARALASSGVHYAAALLSSPDAVTNTLNGNPYDNPQYFQGILVKASDNPRNRGRFSIIALASPDDLAAGAQPYRFGVTDETGKLNLNALFKLDSSGKIAHDILIQLPNMTEDVVNSILDWMDSSSTNPRSYGAKDEYYLMLPTPYHCKNGPFDSLDELLLVKGVTAPLLYGNDLNRNGVLDPNEEDGTGSLDPGWYPYLTIYSRELNVDAQGNPRININDSDIQTLSTNLNNVLPSELANYIIAYRIYGPSSGSQSGSGSPGSSASPAGGARAPAGGASAPAAPAAPAAGRTPTGGGAPTGGAVPAGAGAAAGRDTSGGAAPMSRTATRPMTVGASDMRRGGSRQIGSLYELINSSVAIPDSNNPNQTTSYPSPLNDSSKLSQYLPLLLDETTTEATPEIPARVNVNTAPQAVLAALPNIQDSDVQAILDHRPSQDATQAADPIFQTPAWLITEANLTPKTLQALEKYITARSQVYRVQVVGYFDGGGPMARVEALIDTNLGRPRIISQRDLTELGKGFELPAQQ